MPKPRPDLQYLYSRGLETVEDGRMNCLPVYSRSAQLGLGPTVIYNFGPGPRRRWSRVRRTVRKPRRDNRSTLSAGPLIATYVVIGSKSPLQEVLARGDQAELRANFIVTETQVPKVKIFQVVKDLSAALRQTEHIFAGYHNELEKLTQARLVREDKLRRHRSGLQKLSPDEGLSVTVEIAAINLRVAQIQQISTDRAARDLAIRFVVQESFRRLVEYAEALGNLSRSVSRMGRRFNRKETVEYLRLLDEDLAFFASKEVKRYRALARREIRRITGDEEEKLTAGNIVAILFRVRQYLIDASVALARWAEALPESEAKAAQAMRLATVARTP